MSANKILYDLGATGLGMVLWFTPSDYTRVIGYSLSIVFSASAYYTGVCLLNKERKNDEVEGIQYEASVDFYERFLENHIDSALEVKAMQIETNTLERLIPLLAHKSHLERKIQQVAPVHSELSEEEKESAAKQAIDSAFVEGQSSGRCPQQVTEEEIRRHFPEQLDMTSWKAILKALQNGATRDEIVKDVLGVANYEIGRAYFDYLKRRYLG